MPRGDGTGPMGMGSQTGRGAGYCAGNRMPGYANKPMGAGRHGGRGFGQGQGMGGGRGWRNMFRLTGLPGWMRFGGTSPAASASKSSVDEKSLLERQAEALKAQLDRVQQRLNELQK